MAAILATLVILPFLGALWATLEFAVDPLDENPELLIVRLYRNIIG